MRHRNSTKRSVGGPPSGVARASRPCVPGASRPRPLLPLFSFFSGEEKEKNKKKQHEGKPNGSLLGMPSPRKGKMPSPLFHRKAGKGFTLIEIMVVILILAVLVALVVGISKTVSIEVARRRTVAIQGQLLAAIRAYTDAHNNTPPSDSLSTPPATPPATSGYGSTDPSMWAAQYRIADLYLQLAGEPASAKVLSSLPPEAVYTPTLPFRQSDVNKGKFKLFRDGFDNDMDYRLSGLGGRPVIISAGPDGHFGVVGGVDYDADNIQSDGRGQ
jgi:prepilin-type N-terminal cleavage/methylation domain-containing protein